MRLGPRGAFTNRTDMITLDNGALQVLRMLEQLATGNLTPAIGHRDGPAARDTPLTGTTSGDHIDREQVPACPFVWLVTTIWCREGLGPFHRGPEIRS